MQISQSLRQDAHEHQTNHVPLVPYSFHKVVDMGIGKFGSMKTSCIVERTQHQGLLRNPKKIDVAYRLFENAGMQATWTL